MLTTKALSGTTQSSSRFIGASISEMTLPIASFASGVWPEFGGSGPDLAWVEPLTRGFTEVGEFLPENVGATHSTKLLPIRAILTARAGDNPLNRAIAARPTCAEQFRALLDRICWIADNDGEGPTSR